MAAYYNEFEPFAAEQLRQLIKIGAIADGMVDDRSITDVKPDDIREFTQCHFFAGIGGWPRALRIAGWGDDRPVWTGSCPCQPFSAAGRQKGKADDRHLFPAWDGLIGECRPTAIFGEQVESAIAHGWLDDVYNALEARDYAVGAAVLPACAVGAPHKRNRLWFMACAASRQYERRGTQSNQRALPGSDGENHVADANRDGDYQVHAGGTRKAQELSQINWPQQSGTWEFGRTGRTLCDVADSHDAKRGAGLARGDDIHGAQAGRQESDGQCGAYSENSEQGGFWDSGEWIECADGKARLIESGICLLAHGVRNRVGKLRGYGNAIVPQVAAEFIMAAMI